MVLLSNLKVLHFSGADTADFLHNQVSADVLALSHGESTFACYCEPKGRVLALMLIAKSDDASSTNDYLVIVSRSLAATIATRLKMYVIRAKVNIEIMEDVSIAGVQSNGELPSSAEQLTTITPPDSNSSYVLTEDSSNLSTSSDEINKWKLSELQKGINWLCPETSAQFLPQMLGFDQLGAVNFRKGCYPGQEIVARIHYLGKVKRHPRLLCTPDKIRPEPMEELQIQGGDKFYTAVVTDSVRSEHGRTCILVVTRMDPDLIAEKIVYQEQESELVAD